MQKLSFDQLRQIYKCPAQAAQLSLHEWQSLILILRHHKLLARFQFLFEKEGVLQQLPKYARHHLENARIISEKQYHQVFFEARKLLEGNALQSKNQIFLKGAAYTLAHLNAGKGRIYSDIDILIDAEAIDQVEKNLMVTGWFPEPVNKYDDNYYRKWAHEIPPIKHSSRGTVLDIHHNIIPVISGRSPDISHFFENVVETKDGFSVLTPAAMTLHSIVHLLFNEEFTNSFRDLLDLDLLISEKGSPEFWEELVRLAEETGFIYELSLAVRYLKKILDTHIPENVGNQLKVRECLKTRFQDFLFTRVLLPSHPLMPVSTKEFANTLAFLRGHFLKMPLHILLYHTVRKGYRGSVEYLLGKTFFDKEDPNHRF